MCGGISSRFSTGGVLIGFVSDSQICTQYIQHMERIYNRSSHGGAKVTFVERIYGF